MKVSKQHIPFGIRKIDMKYKGREFNTLFIRQMQPIMLNILLFHEVSFFRNLSMDLLSFLGFSVLRSIILILEKY
jgi:hypothetical protein